jgi:ring-1,2-phenylacetyl-CoA epoxidase subunit PaaE
MRKYYPITVAGLQNETADSVRIALSVPEDAENEFRFLPGQHLSVQTILDGKPVRRTYSICSVPGQAPLEIGVRIQPGGIFSTFVANELKLGDELQVMPPFGQFHTDIEPGSAKTYLAFAAGSGITPILSIMRATLEGEPGSRFLLFYGNRMQRTTMFIDDLYALKNRFPERLQLYFLFSREEQEFEILGGKLDEKKVVELYESFCVGLKPDTAFICGPDTMIETVRNTLIHIGMEESGIHTERYGALRKKVDHEPAAGGGTARQATVTVIMDGHKKTFDMAVDGTNFVDAAAAQGIQLPYSCKGGVCATCRTHLRTGKVRMATNYGLEPWEVEKGFVLACQSVPVSNNITIDYDKI